MTPTDAIQKALDYAHAAWVTAYERQVAETAKWYRRTFVYGALALLWLALLLAQVATS